MVGAASTHKFKIGQLVSYVPGLLGVATRGVYTVTRLLLPRDAEFQYGIKSVDEPYERVVQESQLTHE
jgi:hypothetical protein